MAEIYNNSNINNIFNSRNNLLAQLKKAGYNTTPFADFTINEIYFMERHNELDFKVSNSDNQTVLIKYYLDKPIKPNIIQNYITNLWSTKKDDEFIPDNFTIVFIIKDEPNSSLLELVKQIYAEENIFIILYNIKRLLFNILEHSYVPKHSILSKDEHNQFINKYNITNQSEIPSISRFDPVSLAIFMKPGNICKIIRPNVNVCQSTYYRICLNL